MAIQRTWYLPRSFRRATPQLQGGPSHPLVQPLWYLHLYKHRCFRMDKASLVLDQDLPVGVPRSYRSIADHSGIPRATLHHRARARRSVEEKAQSQQYLTPYEEKAEQMSEPDTPIRIKTIPSIALILLVTGSHPIDRRRPRARTGSKRLRSVIKNLLREGSRPWTGIVMIRTHITKLNIGLR